MSTNHTDLLVKQGKINLHDKIDELLPLHPFNSLFSRTTWASQYQKGKTSLDFNEARNDGVLGWQWHQLDHMQTTYTSLRISTPHHSFLQAGCSTWCPTVSKHWRHDNIKYNSTFLLQEMLIKVIAISWTFKAKIQMRPACYNILLAINFQSLTFSSMFSVWHMQLCTV